jgi:hypothetical protein
MMEDYFRVAAALKRVRTMGTCLGSVVNYPLVETPEQTTETDEIHNDRLSREEIHVLTLATNLGQHLGALLPDTKFASFTQGQDDLLPRLISPSNSATTWVLQLGAEKWCVTDKAVPTDELLKHCKPQHLVRDNIWRFSPASDQYPAVPGACLPKMSEFQLKEVMEITGEPVADGYPVPPNIMPHVERLFKRSVKVVPWAMLVQDNRAGIKLPADLGSAPTIPDTHTLAGILAIPIRTTECAVADCFRVRGLYVGSSVYFTADYASSTKRNKTHWVACPMDTSMTLQRRSNVGAALVVAVLIPKDPSEVVKAVVSCVNEMLHAVPVIGLILPPRCTDMGPDPGSLEGPGLELWDQLHSNKSLDVSLQPIVYENNCIGISDTNFNNKVHAFNCGMLVPKTHGQVATLASKNNPDIHWENVGFVMSTTTSMWRCTHNFLQRINSSVDDEILEACGIAGLTVLTKQYATGDENDTPLKPKYERTVRMLGMSILVRRKEL